MLIDHSLLHFCAEKTREIVQEYTANCVRDDEDEFPRSVDDLYWLIQARYELPIRFRRLNISIVKSDIRACYIRHTDYFGIYELRGLTPFHCRFVRTKELFHIHLDQEALRTRDIIGLVENMMVRASSESADLHLGRATNSETIAELAALEFLFPYERRLRHKRTIDDADDYAAIAEEYQVPQFLIEHCLSDGFMESLKAYFSQTE